MALDVLKPVQTRDGRKARIICTDRCDDADEYRIVALVQILGRELVYVYKADGSLGPRINDLDLINVPTKHVGWMNIYPRGRVSYYYYQSEEGARNGADQGVIATVKVEWEEP